MTTQTEPLPGVDRLGQVPIRSGAGNRGHPRLLALAFVLAAGLHLAWDASVGRMPSWDQAHHLTLGINYAKAAAEGRFREQFQSVYEPYPPGYHLLLAAGTALFGPARALGLYVNLVGLAILMAATYGIGARLANGRVGLMAAILVAMYPGIAVYGREALIEFWMTSVTALSFALLLASRRFQNVWLSLLLGFTMGFGMLLKPSFAFALWLPVFLIFGRALLDRDRKVLLNVAIAGLITAGIAALWYWPQREAIAALARVNRADAIRWGHPTSPWLGFLKHVGFLGDDLMSKFGQYVAIGAFFITAWRWRVLGILHAWILGAWGVVVFGLVFRDPKYLLPTLPPMALLVAWLVDRLKPAPLRTAAIAVLFCAHAIALLNAEFGPWNARLLRLVGTEDKWAGVSGGESWAVPEIVAAARQNAGRSGARVGVLADLPRLNGNVLIWQARRTGSDLAFAAATDSARHGKGGPSDLSTFDMVLLKTGSPGPAYLTDLVKASSRRVVTEPETFKLAATFPLADGSQAKLFVVRGSSRNPATEADVEAVVRASDPAFRDLVFGGRFKMLGMTSETGKDGLLLRIAWQAVQSTPLDLLVAVHLLGDDASKILAQSDYPQDPKKGTVRAGFRWIDSVTISAGRLEGVTGAGVSLYRPGGSGVEIDRGPRDCGNTRLRIPLRR